MPVTATLKLVEDALADARAKLPYGADNKLRQGVSKSPAKKGWGRPQRQKVANQNVSELREFLGAMSLQQYLQEAAHAKAGNCMEFALLAFQYLADKGVEPVRVVRLEKPGDHVFTIAGELGPNGKLADIYTWGDAVFVCDPWANIACAAKDYKAAWLKKMMKWSDAGKEVSYNHKFINPLTQDWELAINKNKLLPFKYNGVEVAKP